MPLISIITVNLNNAPGLRKTIESVLGQTFTDYEYIIIDGGSTDGSLDVIKEYEGKISYWVSESDKGIYNAMNKGILQSRGEYLQFLNSGDWLADTDTLEQIFSESFLPDIIYGNINGISKEGNIKVFESLKEENLSLANFNYSSRATITHPASFIRKNQFETGLYDESYMILADIKFFIQKIVFQNCTVKHISKVIVNFPLDGISSDPSFWGKTIEERSRIFRELLQPKILRDYENYFQVKDSPLLKYIPTLQQTERLNKLVARIVGLILELYKFLKG